MEDGDTQYSREIEFLRLIENSKSESSCLNLIVKFKHDGYEITDDHIPFALYGVCYENGWSDAYNKMREIAPEPCREGIEQIVKRKQWMNNPVVKLMANEYLSKREHNQL